MSDPPEQKRRSPALAVMVIGGVCLIGGLGAAVLYTRRGSDLARPPAAAVPMDVHATGTGATALGVNTGTINIHNGDLPGPKGCSGGLQPFGERCVSQSMADYISCVDASGGNKQELTQAVTSEGKQKTAAEASGAGKGPIVEGSGKLALDLDDEASLVGKLESKWFPGAMSECGKALPGALRQAALKVHKKQGAR